MTAPDRQRDGGVYSPGTVCPHCGTCDVHGDRPADRWLHAEAPFRHIRTCTRCGSEWGQR